MCRLMIWQLSPDMTVYPQENPNTKVKYKAAHSRGHTFPNTASHCTHFSTLFHTADHWNIRARFSKCEQISFNHETQAWLCHQWPVSLGFTSQAPAEQYLLALQSWSSTGSLFQEWSYADWLIRTKEQTFLMFMLYHHSLVQQRLSCSTELVAAAGLQFDW